MNNEFESKKCSCNGSPTCPECNDFGGFNLFDDYKRAWRFQETNAVLKDKITIE